jgi:protocatechuate 3,4-dioxygenase beta subunit
MPRSISLSRRSFLGILGAGTGALLLPTPAIADDDHHGPFPTAPGDSCGGLTADNIEGPFYKRGAPSRATLVGNSDRGERFELSGTVRGTDCKPLANAVLDIWHADDRGGYDNDGWGMRGTLATDARGKFALHTIIPGRYLNGKRFRPAHIHVKVRARGKTELTTQLYFDGDPYIEGDPFVVRSLIMAHRKDGSLRRAAFDFVV